MTTAPDPARVRLWAMNQPSFVGKLGNRGRVPLAAIEAYNAAHGLSEDTRPVRVVDERPATVRQWAKDNGYEIGTQGRVPRDLFIAYRRAMEKETGETPEGFEKELTASERVTRLEFMLRLGGNHISQHR